MLDFHKITQSGWIVLEKAIDSLTGTEIRAVDTGRNILFFGTFAYFTHMLTEYRFCSILATTIAIDVFRQDRSIIQF